MELSTLTPEDLVQLLQIHDKYYKHEFDASELTDGNYITNFKVTDGDRIITAGGVRALTEIVLVTDKSINPRIRRKALIQALQVGLFTSQKVGAFGLHAFVQDYSWEKQLKSHGFLNTAGKPLIYPV